MSTFSFNPNNQNDTHLLSSAERLELLRAEKLNQMPVGSGILELPLATLVGLSAMFCVAFFNLSDLGFGDVDKISIDFTVLMKVGFLGVAGAYGLIGSLTDEKVRRLMFSFPVVWVWFLFGFYCLGVISSVMPKESLVSAISIACVLLCTTRLLVQVGVKVVLTTLFHSMSAFVVLSWFLFLFVPEIGVFEEAITDGQKFRRMGGMAHPNTLGQVSGLTLIFAGLLHRNYGDMTKWRWVICFLAIGALVASVSRTSFLTTLIAFSFIYREKFLRRQNLPYMLGFGFLSVFGLLGLAAMTDLGALVESQLESVSKSGSTEELTTGT